MTSSVIYFFGRFSENQFHGDIFCKHGSQAIKGEEITTIYKTAYMYGSPFRLNTSEIQRNQLPVILEFIRGDWPAKTPQESLRPGLNYTIPTA